MIKPKTENVLSKIKNSEEPKYSKEKTFNFLLKSLEYETDWLENGSKKHQVCSAFRHVVKVYGDSRFQELRDRRKLPSITERNKSILLNIWEIGNSSSWNEVWRYSNEFVPRGMIIKDNCWDNPVEEIWLVKKIILHNFLNADTWLDVEIFGRAFENVCRIFCLLLFCHNRYSAALDAHSDGFQYCSKSNSYALKRLELIKRDDLGEIFPNTSDLTRDDFLTDHDAPF